MKPPKFKNIGKIDGSLVNQDKATVLGGLEIGSKYGGDNTARASIHPLTLLFGNCSRVPI
jgi:hypothetical protein